MTHDQIKAIVANALAEDIGTGDITSKLLIPEHIQAEMLLVAREGLVVCGAFVVAEVYKQLSSSPSPLEGEGRGEGAFGASAKGRSPHPNPPPQGGREIVVQTLEEEGTLVAEGTPLVKITGPARLVLTGERVALNLMQRMCGIATLTHVYVDAVKGTKAIILDTRKTMPGLRLLDKQAVRTGGGQNHRMRLDDMVLIKDNHLAIRGQDSGFRVQEVIEEVKSKLSSRIPIVVECDTLEQVAATVDAKPDRILLDNMDIKTLRQAVAMVAGRVPLEASGGVSLDKVRSIAETGVDFISVGKITHSAPSADIGADISVQ